jgi:pimeloyl-ACP methyl ester carboxylesterase
MTMSRRDFLGVSALCAVIPFVGTACSSDDAVDQGSGATTGRSVPDQVGAPTAFTTRGNVAARKYDVRTDGGATAGLAGRTVLYVPDSLLSTDVGSVPVAMTAHGYTDDAATWLDKGHISPMRDALLEAGYVVVSPYHEATFGNADSQSRIQRARSYVGNVWDVSGTVLMGFSMGGGISAAALHRRTLPDVRGAFLTAPLLDWSQVYLTRHDDFTYQASAALFAAYGATDQESFLVNCSGYDPMQQPARAYAGIRALVRSSPEDTSIDQRTNALAWVDLVQDQAAEVDYTEVTGEHGSDSHFGDTDEIIAFFDQAMSASN